MSARGVLDFTFALLALVILVAEFGGRRAAVATAVAAALSLDFFLTAPYLHLEIHDKHDVTAFLGLAGCGLLCALLASRRGTGSRTPEARVLSSRGCS